MLVEKVSTINSQSTNGCNILTRANRNWDKDKLFVFSDVEVTAAKCTNLLSHWYVHDSN